MTKIDKHVICRVSITLMAFALIAGAIFEWREIVGFLISFAPPVDIILWVVVIALSGLSLMLMTYMWANTGYISNWLSIFGSIAIVTSIISGFAVLISYIYRDGVISMILAIPIILIGSYCIFIILYEILGKKACKLIYGKDGE